MKVFPKDINNRSQIRFESHFSKSLSSSFWKQIFTLIFIVLIIDNSLFSQNIVSDTVKKDSITLVDTTRLHNIEDNVLSDSLVDDTTKIVPKPKESVLEDIVNYKCTDSLHFRVKEQKVYLLKT